MPVTIAPTIDDRRYQDLVDEALARIPVHNPEWTNFGSRSDPGVTLIELFAFLTENLLYRANQIPERNRRKFLSLLGVPLQPGGSASGIVQFVNDRGPLSTITLNEGLEVRAGDVPFRIAQTLDVLPIETRMYVKRERFDPDARLKEYYLQLYASYRTEPAPPDLKLYDTVVFMADGSTPVDLGDAVDRSLWVALLARPDDVQRLKVDEALRVTRDQIEGKTLSLGIIPALGAAARELPPGQTRAADAQLVQFWIPVGTKLPGSRVPQYRLLDAVPGADVLAVPGVVQITLPSRAQLAMWSDLDPLEAGVGDFPPAIEDTANESRVMTWIRIRAVSGTTARFLWAGINSAMVTQRAHIVNELLPAGTGEPDQSVTLARSPVIAGTVKIVVDDPRKPWEEIDDLFAAGPEVAAADARTPPGGPRTVAGSTDVFVLDPESGVVRFGDGLHGRRPASGAVMRATYDYSVGSQGNVGPGSINSGPALPAGLKVSNPVRTWGGSAPEPVSDGEKQISRYLQHRDRLVTVEDFKTITERTPGVDIGRVDVLPAYSPELPNDEPGNAPGAVTLLVIPRVDPEQPDAPRPDRLFLDAICRYIDPRRLVTTEVFLRAPKYKPIWVAVGVRVVGGQAIAKVREAVRHELLDFLSPLARERQTADSIQSFAAWPLRKSVIDRELMAVVSRVTGVLLVTNVTIAHADNAPAAEIPMQGLELPRVMGISVTEGDPVDLSQLRGAPVTERPPVSFVPVPVIPEGC